MILQLDMTFKAGHVVTVERLVWDYMVHSPRDVRCISPHVTQAGVVSHPDLESTDKEPLEQHLKLGLMNFKD